MFNTNWQGVTQTTIHRGAYHFFTTGSDPIVQADSFLKDVGMLGAGDLPPVIDVESGSFNAIKPDTAAHKQTIIDNINKWLTHVSEKTGRTPIMYVGADAWQSLGNPTGFSQYPLWIPAYGNTDPVKGTSFASVPIPAQPPVRIPGDFGTWVFWQVRGTTSKNSRRDSFYVGLRCVQRR